MNFSILSSLLVLSPSPVPQTITPSPVCAEQIADQAGGCLDASSVPTLGSLYPLSQNLFVSPTGNVGIGTTAPAYAFHVSAPTHPSGVAARVDYADPQGGVGLWVDVDGVNTSPFGSIGIFAETEWSDGIGILGSSSSIPFGLLGSGVSGASLGTISTGETTAAVFGWAFGNVDGYGVYGLASSNSGHGVLGRHNDSAGVGAGVSGWSDSSDTWARGVEGDITSGVHGRFSSCVYGRHPSSDQNGIAVAGIHASRGFGLWGDALGDGVGIRGASGAGGLAVLAAGDFVTTGFKSFAQPHPKDPSKEIRFVCLEGNESGTYFRGSAKLVDGRARIEVPEDFRLASERESITVQVTPLGPALLWIEEKGLDRIVVRGESDIEFDYFVNGVRRGFASHETIQDNRCFKPDFMDEPFGGQYPEEMRRILIENGTLNPDFTPNLATARELGWELLDGADHPRNMKKTDSRPPVMASIGSR